MTGATLTPLGDLADLQAGVGFPLDLQGRDSGDYPLAKVGDISRVARSGQTTLFAADHYVDEADLRRLKAKPIPAGSILFSKIGEAIRQNHRVIAGCPLLIDNNAMAAIPNERVESRYLYHYLRTVDFYALASATTVPALRKSELERLMVPVPPLPEQRRIAEILDKADALRAKRRAALAQLDTLTQSIFLDMFGDPATNPKGWPVVTLESKCTIAGEYGANVPSTEFNPDLPRYVRITDVTEEGELNDQPVSPAGSRNDWEQYELAPGDLLFARSGATVGKTYMHKESVGRCVFAGYMIRFRPDRRELLSEYLFAFTRSTAYRAWVAARQRVVAQPNINAKQYGRELLIPLPPIQQQEAFAARMLDIERTKTLLRKSREALDELCKALQRSAFRGQL